MGGNLKIILPIIIPIIGAIVVFFLNKLHNKTLSRTVFVSFTFITAICCVINCFDTSGEFIMGYIAGEFPIEFKIDELGVYFSLLTSLIWFVVAIYTCRYISHEENENLFLGFYLLVYGILVALDYSANIVTMYLFYELMTVATLTLVLYSRTKEGISAGLKYIAYSLFGAALGLVCILFVVFYGDGIDFREGGVFTNSSVDKDILLIVTFLGIVGFGTKAGIFPLHGWLPIAHPVAPAPASAVLSGILTKSGVLAIIRLVYYIVAADLIRGEWVQYAWIILALTTVLMGSLLAYKEKNLKKRLAYSTVSQVSYILFGLALLEESAFAGAMMHIAFHSVIKVCLFLCAGAIIFKTHLTDVDDLDGIGKKMPALMTCFTIASLGLVGIPPLNAFVSKWFLIEGSFNADIPVISWLGPIVLITSALLTAGYLLKISYKAFWGDANIQSEVKSLSTEKSDYLMIVSVIILAVLTLLMGLYSSEIFTFIESIINIVF